jgi:hypothetical protein
MNLRNPMLGVCLACAMLAASAHAAPFLDPLDVPAPLSPLASKSIVQAVTRAGTRLVAVGQRGHVLVSDDGGKSWRQSPVPVSSDLTSVFFVDERSGWAVGHDGVILATSRWRRNVDAAARRQARQPGDGRRSRAQARSEALLAEANRNVAQGADKPFLDVWFATGTWVTRSVLTTTSSGPTTAARPGSPGSTAPTIRSTSTCTRSVPPRADCSSPAKRASC